MFVLFRKYNFWSTASLLSFAYINYKHKTIYSLNNASNTDSFSNNTNQYNIESLIDSYNLPLLTQVVELNNIDSPETMEEEYLVLGEPDMIKPGMMLQFDIGKIRTSKAKNIQPGILNDIQEYFQKILVTKVNGKICVVSSFCGYDFTDLSKGEMIGNRLICPTCMSEYNVENGHAEQGPNIRYLATFPASIRDDLLKIRVPNDKIPLFQLPQVADFNNPADPRHYVLIGDNETVQGAIDTLTKIYTGKISIITNKSDTKFYDLNKLKTSFFPIRSSNYIKLLTDDYLKAFKIDKYDNKVSKIDAVNRILTLDNGTKIPFDKVLIATGAQRKRVAQNNSNIFNLYTIEDHLKIHNIIVKPETKTVVVISNLLEGFDIVTSLRTYLNAIGKEDTNVVLVSDKDSFLETICPNEYLVKIQKYLQDNKIELFRGIVDYDFEMNENTGKINKVKFNDKKYYFQINTDICILQDTFEHSNVDFLKNIIISQNKIGDQVRFMYGNFLLPDERMSLYEGTSYPFLFTAGSCSLNMHPGLDIMSRGILTPDFKTNFQLGFYGAINMLEKHPPFDDVIVQRARLMNKRLTFIGNDRHVWDNKVVLSNPKNGDFCVFLFTGQKLSGFLIYGFRNFHIYARELLRYSILPSYGFVMNNLNQMPEFIATEVRKRAIDCYKETAFKDLQVNLNKYSIEDQAYVVDLLKRGKVAVKEMGNKIEEDYKKDQEKIKKRKEELEKGKR
jgi:nitrite reductase/ring-hydroxylating ferredoxin subunit